MILLLFYFNIWFLNFYLLGFFYLGCLRYVRLLNKGLFFAFGFSLTHFKSQLKHFILIHICIIYIIIVSSTIVIAEIELILKDIIILNLRRNIILRGMGIFIRVINLINCRFVFFIFNDCIFILQSEFLLLGFFFFFQFLF